MGERGLIVIKMDKLSDNRVEAYKKVGSTAIFIVICVVQIVNAFIDIGYIQNLFPHLAKWVVQLIDIVINLLLYSVLYIWIFDMCKGR